ncbi:hypothetical protein BC939DRAFT_497885 [Gamsiella multidivaricata]|uniref:uncharacterized protein n=1 Tax=Gamsiella multidivaricata TaxID=101098 RepID=UPI002221246F|nr:uncharacterized protein BC939DRAFT_497885 [Gamsiella multidivaricata]KAI7815792.1 hypothetical protein BC939DRAFT_497885 [Gamsiella multidivaricata]
MRVFSPQLGTKAEDHPAKELWNEGVLATAKEPEAWSLCCGMRVYSPQLGTKAEDHPAKELWNEGVLATAKEPEAWSLCCGMRVYSPQLGTKAEDHPAKELWNEGVLATAKGTALEEWDMCYGGDRQWTRILGQGTRMATTGREVYLLGIAQRYFVEHMLIEHTVAEVRVQARERVEVATNQYEQLCAQLNCHSAPHAMVLSVTNTQYSLAECYSRGTVLPIAEGRNAVVTILMKNEMIEYGDLIETIFQVQSITT